MIEKKNLRVLNEFDNNLGKIYKSHLLDMWFGIFYKRKMKMLCFVERKMLMNFCNYSTVLGISRGL